MNYELALELQKAGFPQSANGRFLFDNGYDSVLTGFSGHPNDYVAYAPTLRELIDACGDGFTSLERVPMIEGPVLWQANGKVNERILADTPEEAAGRLWLELSKKTQGVKNL